MAVDVPSLVKWAALTAFKHLGITLCSATVQDIAAFVRFLGPEDWPEYPEQQVDMSNAPHTDVQEVRRSPVYHSCHPQASEDYTIPCPSRPGSSRLFSTHPSRADHIPYISDVRCEVHSVLVSVFQSSPAANSPIIPTRLPPCPPNPPRRESIASSHVAYSTNLASTFLIPP